MLTCQEPTEDAWKNKTIRWLRCLNKQKNILKLFFLFLWAKEIGFIMNEQMSNLGREMETGKEEQIETVKMKFYCLI